MFLPSWRMLVMARCNQQIDRQRAEDARQVSLDPTVRPGSIFLLGAKGRVARQAAPAAREGPPEPPLPLPYSGS
eukprot:6207832-Alexandrium_andersonii.AAC.1